MARHGRNADPKAHFFSGGRKEATGFAGVPQCPKDLNAAAKKKWREVIKLLSAMDILTKADKDLIELYCLAYSRHQAAQAMLNKFGEILKSKQGGLYRSPYLDVVNHASKELQKLGKSLGLDPVSRKKLGIHSTRRMGVSARDRSKGPPPPTSADQPDL